MNALTLEPSIRTLSEPVSRSQPRRSAHASARAQQRCIPPIVEQWLDTYGAEEFDGHGCVRTYFNKASVRQMERELGREFVSRCRDLLNAYRIEAMDGTTITLGWRNHRIARR
jgi:hypothetical protein